MGPYLKSEKYIPELSEIRAKIAEYFKKTADSSVIEIKTGLLELILTRGTIVINDCDTYPYHIVGSGDFLDYREAQLNRVRCEKLKDKLEVFADGQNALLYTGDADFSHTVPDWKRLLSMGFPGIVLTLENKITSPDLTDRQKSYLSCTLRVYRAILIYLERLADECASHRGYEKVATAYRALICRPPSTLFEVLSMMIVFYFLQEKLDTELLRSMGGLDELLLPYYKNDIAHGISASELDSDIAAFMLQLREFGFINNIPFFICRSDFSGHTRVNEMSYKLLQIYSSLNIQDPKIQIRCGSDIPEDLLQLAMESIRAGNNSIVFMNDAVILSALENLGFEREDIEEYAPVGCYEPSVRGELACTCAGRINLPKIVELTLSNGIDSSNGFVFEENAQKIDSWEGFYASFLARIRNAFDCVKSIMEIYEGAYEDINPSLILAPTYQSVIDNATDLFEGGAKYNNTSVNVFGIASTVDSLETIRHVVYVDKLYSADEFARILASNWDGKEKFRLKCIKCYPKYGNGDDEADAFARKLVDDISFMINGVQNSRGGVFRLGMFSIDWYMQFGEKIGATADGRHKGDVISKNMCAVIGRDTHGVTGAIRSAAAADGRKIPNGTVLDLILDASVTKGNDGIISMIGLVKSYFELGGTAIQINVLDPEELRKAKKHPEEYSSLQVRLCGWNVYFTELSEREQDEFIAMAENIAC